MPASPLLRRVTATAAVLLLGTLTLPAAASAGFAPTDTVGTGADATVLDTSVAPGGTAAVLWSDGKTLKAAVKPRNGIFQPAQTLATTPTEVQEARLAVSPAGHAVAFWPDGEAVRASFRPKGGSWSAPQAIGTADVFYSGDALFKPDGTAVLAWPDDGVLRVTIRKPGGQFEPAPRPELPGDEQVASASLAATPGGDLAVAWTALRQTAPATYRLRAAVLPAGKVAFGAPKVLDAQPHDASNTLMSGMGAGELAARPDGTFDVTWLRHFAWSFAQNCPDGGCVATNSVWSGTLPPGGTWSTKLLQKETVTVPESGPTPLITPLGFPSLANAADGTGHLAWTSTENTTTTVRRARRAPGAAFPGLSVELPGAAAYQMGFGVIGVGAVADGTGVIAYTRQDTQAAVVVRPDGTHAAPRTLGPGEVQRGDLHTDGDGAAGFAMAWSHAYGDKRLVSLSLYDAEPPELPGVTVPATATAGAPIKVFATADDALSAPVKVTWALGDGRYASGATTTISYATPGTRQVTARARDAAGNLRTVTRTIEVRP